MTCLVQVDFRPVPTVILNVPTEIYKRTHHSNRYLGESDFDFPIRLKKIERGQDAHELSFFLIAADEYRFLGVSQRE